MRKEFYSKEDQDSSTTPFLETSSASRTTARRNVKRHISSSFLLRHRLFGLSLISLISTIVFTLYFKIPSTLWVYLTAVLILLPISILHDLLSLISSKGNFKVWWTRSRTIWVSLETVGILLLALPHWKPNPNSRLSAIKSWNWSRTGAHGGAAPATFDNHRNQTFFISANLFQSQDILPTFSNNLIDLSRILGEENVFISIYESNSVDATKRLLGELDLKLLDKGIKHRLVSDDAGEHVDAGDSEKAGRIKMLANARNKAQSAFYQASIESERINVRAQESLEAAPSGSTDWFGRKFDKIIWLNDIVFEPKDVLELINTHGGDFDQACGMDFVPLGLYDTWVARSSEGKRLKPLWPYFSSSNDVERLRRNLPIEVNSCWDGLTAFDAKWFYANYTSTSASTSTSTQLSISPTSSSSANQEIRVETYNQVRSGHGENKMQMVSLQSRKIRMPSNASAEMPDPLPLRFRTSKRCYSSECLLISYDLHRAIQPMGRRPKIVMNPNVRVAYDHRQYYLYSKLMRFQIVAPWRLVWQDFISNQLFGWITDLGRKPDECKEYLNLWAPPPPVIPLDPVIALEKA